MSDTPLMKQYRLFKKQYAEQILFFRLGDFYEMFDEDAVEVSSLLNLTLTHKGDSPMCGIPFHAAKNYIKRLLDCGKKIAVCEQLELSQSSKELAKRDVVRIITPATVVEEDFVDEQSSNYILCVFQNSCAYCDITTGDFRLRNFDSKTKIHSFREVLCQVFPKEILVCDDEYYLNSEFKNVVDESTAMITKLPPWYFNKKKAYELLTNHLHVTSLASFGLNKDDNVIAPAGALLIYANENSKNNLVQINNYILDDKNSYLCLDESSRKNLELFKNLYDGSNKYSLCDTINRCKTSGGYRLLKSWLCFPLRNLDEIKERQKRITFFYNDNQELDRVRQIIGNSSDLNRMTTRVLMKRSVPRDLVGIKNTISAFFNLIAQNTEYYKSLLNSVFSEDKLSQCAKMMDEIDRAVNDQFLGQFNAGEVILSGYDHELDVLRSMKSDSDKILNDYLEQEKTQNNLSILKLGFNRVFGYYLEIPKGQTNKAPSYYYRKQTLVNGERYTTDQLMQYETQILSSTAQAEEREKILYDSLNNLVIQNIDILNAIGSFISELDVYQAMATLAIDSNYICPQITEDDVLLIENGRHPVVEKQLKDSMFVANNLDMSKRFVLITGPNMAGKSTYLRQNALIILLAHIGSYVPASKAKIGLMDKIFCRVGASDNLARGESTFLIEMQETAYILRNSTCRSFVIVDEIGRGTSTQDGMSIAYAVMQSLVKKNVKTLFATHYHELTMMDTSDIHLQTLAVEENKGNVVFLRKVIDGVANSSYGIHVAKLAGIPSDVIKEARSFQCRHFADYTMQQSSLFTSSEDLVQNQDCMTDNKIIEELNKINVEDCTPMQALILLSKLKDLCSDVC